MPSTRMVMHSSCCGNVWKLGKGGTKCFFSLGYSAGSKTRSTQVFSSQGYLWLPQQGLWLDPLWEERQLIKFFVGRLGVLAFSKLAFVNIMYIITYIVYLINFTYTVQHTNKIKVTAATTPHPHTSTPL